MSEQAHTPGPWEVNEIDATATEWGMLTVDVADDATDAVCQVFGENDGVDYERTHAEAVANARLIAAAPDLLAALREIAELEGDCEQQQFRLTRFQASQIARAAIAKARNG
jgi:hypothetical protein